MVNQGSRDPVLGGGARAASDGAGATPPNESDSRRRVWGLHPNVFWAGVASFFMDVSTEMVYSLVPIFLSSVLGVNKSVIGVIEGIAETTASLVKMFAGWLSDRLGLRKPLMVGGYGVSTLSRILLALATSWSMVLGSRFVDRFGKGIRTAPRDAIVADSSEKARLGRSFGFHRAMDQFGAVVGPLVAFLVLAFRPEDYRTVFWISLLPGGLCVAVIVFFIRERKRGEGDSQSGGRRVSADPPLRSGSDYRQPSAGGALGRPPHSRVSRPLLFYLMVMAVFSLGNSSDAFLILRARDLGVAAFLVPVLYLVFNLVYAGVAVPAGLLADRIGRQRVALIGFALFALAYAWMAMARGELEAWGIFTLYGIYMGVADGNSRALLADLTQGVRHGTSFGAFHMVVGLAALPASVMAGLLYDHVSPQAPFWLGAGGAVLAGVLMVILVRPPSQSSLSRSAISSR